MNASVLVTGGTGSFGNAYVRHLLRTDVERVLVYSRDELKQSQMREVLDDERLRFIVADVCDTDRLARALRGVDLIVHAAALKQIDACEINPAEAVRVNVDGTKSVVDAVLATEVPRAVFLSTDKAAAPVTLYGATKLTAERLWTQANVYAAGTPTRFAATRYGNVIGSRGSVVEIWRRLIAEKQPIKLTDPLMSRFWMRLDDAVALVNLAVDRMKGGEVFVPKVKAATMDMLLDAVVQNPTPPVEVIGIRRGEKMHEVLIAEDEARYTWDHITHYRIEPARSWENGHVYSVSREQMAEGWSFDSRNAPQLTTEQLRRMIG